MITEIALLHIKPELDNEFENAFSKAQSLIKIQKGFISHELQKCIEEGNKYLLIVRWETLEDHTIGFRQSEEYAAWKKLLHHYYDPFPVVEHYKKVFKHGSSNKTNYKMECQSL